MRHLLTLLTIILCINLNGQRKVLGELRIDGSTKINHGGVRGQTLFPGNWLNATSTLIYTLGEKNYVNGTNNFGDLAKGEKFVVGDPYYIVGALFWIGVLEGDAGNVHFNVWDFASVPKTVLASKSLSISYLKQHVDTSKPFYIEFDQPVLVTKDYLIGVEFSDIGDASFSLVSSMDGQGGGLDYVFEQWFNGDWYSYLNSSSWGLDIDLGIFPSVEEVIISDDFEGGTGTLSDPYKVKTPDQLNKVRKYLSAHFIQVADIDLGISPWNTGSGWIPLGSPDAPFRGNYNGNGYLIKNLKIERFQSDYQGLFGYIDNGSVQNLSLQSGKVAANRYVGGLSGYCEKCNLFNIKCTYDVSGSDFTGGMIGFAGNATLTKLYAHAKVKGQKYTGGLVGLLSGKSQLTESYSYGHVEGTQQTGGLIGMMSSQSTRIVSSSSGVIAVIPRLPSDETQTITLTDANPSAILRAGEIQASPVVKVNINGMGILSGNSLEEEGFPVYEIRFPITIQNAIEEKLRVRVRMRDDTRLPVFGNYDKERNTYSIFTYGLINDWIFGVVSGDAVTKVGFERDNNADVRSIAGWTTFDFEIIDDSDINLSPAAIKKEDIEKHILPIARDVLINYHAAGFSPPKLYADNKNSYKLHLINTDQPGHNAISGSSYYYRPDGSNLLGGIYIYYKPNYIPDPLQPSTWKLDYVISHEIFHAIQSGYGYTTDNVKSAHFGGDASIATSYEEGTATLAGSTYTKHKRVDTGTVTLHPDEDFMKLGHAFDDYNINPYSKQDFFAFLSKRYYNGSLEFLGPMWQDIADSWKKDYTRLLEFYREGLDKFLKSNGKSLSRAYTDFAMQRLYIHEPEYLLRDQSDENSDPNNWFAKNFLTSFLLEDGKTFKKWNSSSETVYDYNPVKIESLKSLASASIVMKLPGMISEDNIKDSIELKLALSPNVNANQNLDEEGIRIVAIRANSENGNPVENNPSVVIKDISKPFKISLKDGVTHLVFIFINAYTKFTETDIILEQKKEKEFTAVRISFEGDHTWQIAGDFIKPLPDPKVMEFVTGSSPDPNDDLKWTLNEFISESYTYIVGLFSKLKVTGRLSQDRKNIEYIDYFYEDNWGNYVKNVIKIENIRFNKELSNGVEFLETGSGVKQKILEVENQEISLYVNYPPENNYRKYISTEFNNNTKIRIQFFY